MRNRIAPLVCADYDSDGNSYDVEVQLPGARKEDIDLRLMSGGFMVRAPRADMDDTYYSGSYNFCCPVQEDSVRAEFDNGLLKMSVDLKEPYQDAKRVALD